MLQQAMLDVLGAVSLRETLHLLISAVKTLKVAGVHGVNGVNELTHTFNRDHV
jgi:hypothetical protein